MIAWAQRIVALALVALAVTGALYVRSILELPRVEAADPIKHLPAAPTIGQVKALASLVVLDVPITDVMVSELDGLTGGTKLAMAVAGDVQIATDLDGAQFIDIDRVAMTAVLRLRRPEAGRPRVDHEKTRVLVMERSGLWSWLPGEAGEKTLTDRAMREAQRRLLVAAQREDLRTQACEKTERVISGFFAALGWTVQVQWDDAPRAANDELRISNYE